MSVCFTSIVLCVDTLLAVHGVLDKRVAQRVHGKVQGAARLNTWCGCSRATYALCPDLILEQACLTQIRSTVEVFDLTSVCLRGRCRSRELRRDHCVLTSVTTADRKARVVLHVNDRTVRRRGMARTSQKHLVRLYSRSTFIDQNELVTSLKTGAVNDINLI